MNFNQLANVISENITSTIVASEEMEGARGRAANPEIEKLVSQGLPYWKARAMVRKGLTGAAEDKPVITSIKSKSDMGGSSAQKAKTQSAVDDYVRANPDATLDNVVDHLKALNAGPLGIKTSYLTTPKDVADMLSIAKGEEPEEAEFDPEAEKKAKFERLRMFLKMSRKERDKFLARKSKDTPVKDTDEEDEEEEVDPYVRSYLSGMKKDKEDFDEIDPLTKD
jgi:hypothetical protein